MSQYVYLCNDNIYNIRYEYFVVTTHTHLVWERHVMIRYVMICVLFFSVHFVSNTPLLSLAIPLRVHS